MKELFKALVPSGVRKLRRERRLMRIHGFAAIGSDDSRRISPSTRFGHQCRISGRVYVLNSTVGDYSYLEDGCRLLAADLGKFCAVAPKAQIGLADHPIGDYVTGHPAFYQHEPRLGYDFVEETRHQDTRRTTLGSDVWVGASACIKDGVTIEHGAIVGAASVVTRNVPPYAIVAGAPARVIRYRFDEATIEWLLALSWWDRSEAWLRAHAKLMCDIEALKGIIDEYGDEGYLSKEP